MYMLFSVSVDEARMWRYVLWNKNYIDGMVCFIYSNLEKNLYIAPGPTTFQHKICIFWGKNLSLLLYAMKQIFKKCVLPICACGEICNQTSTRKTEERTSDEWMMNIRSSVAFCLHFSLCLGCRHSHRGASSLFHGQGSTSVGSWPRWWRLWRVWGDAGTGKDCPGQSCIHACRPQ